MATILSAPGISASISGSATSSTSFPKQTGGSQHSVAVNYNVAGGAGNVDTLYQASFTVTSGTPLSINLATALDVLGVALGDVDIVGLLIENDSATAGQDFTVGSGTDPALGTQSYLVQANTTSGSPGFVCVNFPLGLATTSGTSNLLQITVAAGTNVPGKISILGRNS